MFLRGKDPFGFVFITLSVLNVSAYCELGIEGMSADGSPKINQSNQTGNFL